MKPPKNIRDFIKVYLTAIVLQQHYYLAIAF